MSEGFTYRTTRANEIGGWPADRGPLKALHELGLIPDPNVQPSWVGQARWHPNPKLPDRPTYRGTSRFLNQNGIRHLAALTLEGWEVFINPLNHNTVEYKIAGKP